MLEEIPCIFGHGYNEAVAIEENGFKGRRCATCGLIYISPRPSVTEIFNVYHHDKAYLQSSFHIHDNPAATLAARHHLRYLRALSQPPASILEIGCGGGHFLKAAQDASYQVFGIELNPFQAEHVTTILKIPCERNPFSVGSFGTRNFDVIYHVDVLSHLPDPIADFKMMYDKLKPGGHLLFETGNGADIHPRYYRFFNVFQYPDHLFFFGRQTIVQLLKSVGFSEIRIRSWSIVPQLTLSKVSRSRRKTAQKNDALESRPEGRLRNNHRRSLAAHFFHLVRYRLGAIPVPEDSPQTMLISCKKPN
jgi:SAM-dependent methyltransferase